MIFLNNKIIIIYYNNNFFNSIILIVQDIVVHLHILRILTDFSLLNFILPFNTKPSHERNHQKKCFNKSCLRKDHYMQIFI